MIDDDTEYNLTSNIWMTVIYDKVFSVIQFRILPHRPNVILGIENCVKKRIVSVMPPGVLPVNYVQCVNKIGRR